MFHSGISSRGTFGSLFATAGYAFRPDPETGVMEKTGNMPVWVYLAFSGIASRKGALRLIGACAVFSIYCIPWGLLFPDRGWVVKLFLVEDWSWFAMMVPVMLSSFRMAGQGAA